MKKGILLTATIIFLFTACFAQAQEGELTGTLDVTYRSAYTWYGLDRAPSVHGRGATVSTLDLDLYDTGFGVSTKWVLMNSSSVGNSGGSLVDAEELWLTLTYGGSCLEYETYATNYTIGWTYYDFPDMPSSLSDTQEIFATLSWPEICPTGIVPSYTIVRMWKSESGPHITSGPPVGSNPTQDISGWIHILGLGYDLPIEDLLPDLPEQILHLSAAVVYNEGAGGSNVDHDLSHFVLGVSTDFDLGNDLTLTPGIYHQNTGEKSVNPDEDLTWVSVGLKYAF